MKEYLTIGATAKMYGKSYCWAQRLLQNMPIAKPTKWSKLYKADKVIEFMTMLGYTPQQTKPVKKEFVPPEPSFSDLPFQLQRMIRAQNIPLNLPSYSVILDDYLQGRGEYLDF